MKLNGQKDMLALVLTNSRGSLTICHNGEMTYRGTTWTFTMPTSRADAANFLALLKEAAQVVEDLNG